MELLVLHPDALKRAVGETNYGGNPLLRLRPVRIGRPRAATADLGPKLVANLITRRRRRPGFSTMDLHSGQIQGFFDIPTDNLQARADPWRPDYRAGPLFEYRGSC